MEADECNCKQCAPEGNGGTVCHHDEVLGHKIDLEAVPQRPYAAYSNHNLIQILREGWNITDNLRQEIIRRLGGE